METGEAIIEVDPAIVAILGIMAIADTSPRGEPIVVADILAEHGPMEHRMEEVVTAAVIAAVVTMAATDS